MIAIKGMGMPKSCGDCPRTGMCSTYLNQYVRCPSTRYSYGQDKRPTDCPLVEIVTCKDCEYRDKVHPSWLSNKKDEVYFCTLQSDEYCYEVEDDFYCGDGKFKVSGSPNIKLEEDVPYNERRE